MTLNLNVTPYYDDYDINKGYLKILFKPGNSVQAREMTQVQSLLQQQISNLSDHFFKEGAMVIPGQMAVDQNANYVKVDLAATLQSANDFVGKIVQGNKTGLKALVVKHADVVDGNSDGDFSDYIADGDEPTTLYLKYLEGAPASTAQINIGSGLVNIENSVPGTTTFTINGETVTIDEGSSSTFVEGETLVTTSTDGTNLLCTVMTNGAITNPIGKGSIAMIEEGVYYISGKLVKVQAQSIILSKYVANPTFKVGLEVTESVITSNDDVSLLDNSLGSVNFNAPGADRLQIKLTLTKKPIDVIDTTGFVELITVSDGQIASEAARDDYEILMKTLARRTYDESGNYTVRPFILDIREYFKENLNGGAFEMSDMVFDTAAAAVNWAVYYMPNSYGMVIGGIGQSHQITQLDRTNYPNQGLDTTGTKYYPGLTHENLLDAVRSKIAIGVESGKAYVKGYEVTRKPKNKYEKYIIYDKARDTYKENNSFVPVDLGPFVYVSDLKGLPKIDSRVNLVNAHIGNDATTKWINVPSDSAISSMVPNGTAVNGAAGSIPLSMFQSGTGSTGTLGTNIYGLDVVATAKVKAIKYFEDSSSSAIGNNFLSSNFTPQATIEESAIWKLYLYDVEFEKNPRTDTEYSLEDARSITSVEAYATNQYYDFGANILTKLSMVQREGNFTLKSLLYEKDNDGIRGITYHWNNLTGLLLVKPLNSGNISNNGQVGTASVLPTDGFSINRVILEAVGTASGGNFANGPNNTDATALISGAGGRLFNKQVIHSTTGSSMIDSGNTFLKTIRSIDDVSGNATVDTQYSVTRQIVGSSSDGASKVNLTLSASDEFFEQTTSLYYCWKAASAAVSETSGSVQSLSSFEFGADLKSVSFVVSGGSNMTGLNLLVPVRKTQSKEKIKTKNAQTYMPYSLVDLTGQDKTGYDWTSVAADTTTNDALSYGVDIAAIRSSSSGTINATLENLGTNSNVTLSVSEFQLHHSDIINLDKLYDTCNVNNYSYRTGIQSSDKKNLHQMVAADFEFVLSAYNFYEQTGTSPFNVILQNNTNTTTYSEVEAQLTIAGVANPFSNEILNLFVSGVAAIPNPSDIPVKINDITDRYILESGAKSSVLGLGKVYLKNGSIPCGGRPIIIYSYFSHGIGDYASVDSYPSYAEIDNFNNTRLSDVFDFRPALVWSQLDSSGGTIGGGWPHVMGVHSGSSTDYPRTGSAISADLQGYMGRSDKLYVSPEQQILVKYGSSSFNPKYPEDPTDGMVIYNLTTPPYTIHPDVIMATMIDNKRYTMRDIGKLDKRISNLEYYTTLNMLEKDAMDMEVTDENGNDRFKNGFIVDQFTNHKVGATADPDYRVSVDSSKNELRPFFTEKNINLEINSVESSNFALKEQKIFLPYTSSQIMAQEKSSKTVNVNPFAIFSFKGSVNLFPSSDDWKETKDVKVITDRRDEFDALSRLLPEDGSMGAVWGGWDYNWSGVLENDGDAVPTALSWHENYHHTSQNYRPPGQGGIQRFNRVSQPQKEVGTRNRSGTEEFITRRDKTETIGNSIIATEIIPYIRSRSVYFSAEKMKPNTKLYPYFDGVDVGEFCETCRVFTFTGTSPSILAGFFTASGSHLIVDHRGKMTLRGNTSGHSVNIYEIGTSNSSGGDAQLVLRVAPDILSLAGADGTRTTSFTSGEEYTIRWPDPDKPLGFSERDLGSTFTKVEASSTIKSDDVGFVSGIFNIPNTSNIRFSTGERLFRISDQINNSGDSGTEAEATYAATGVIETIQEQIVLTRVAEFETRPLYKEEPTSQGAAAKDLGVVPTGEWYDPLAQTISVDMEGGIFVTAVDLFFSTKDDTKPVTCQLRHTVNGYPGPRIMGSKILYPRDVNISEKGELPTQFVFDSPIYCANKTEYCIVIMADTQGYRAHVSRMGEESLDGSGTISAQPHAGVFFKSQNASTWTADQMEDLKFRVHRAVFDTSVRSQVFLHNSEFDDNNNQIFETEFRPNSMKISANSTKVTFFVGDSTGCVPTDRWRANGYNYVTISNIHGTYDLFPSTSLNGDHLITDCDYDSFSIDLRNQFYAAGSTSLSIPYSSSTLPTVTNSYNVKSNTTIKPRFKTNFKYDVMKPIVQTIELPKTGIDMSFRGLSGTSQDSNNIPGVKDPNYQFFTPNSNITFNSPRMIATSSNERLFNTNSSSIDKKSFAVKLDLFSDADNVSPVVDTQRMSLIVISNKTNSPENTTVGQRGYVNGGFIDETAATNGSAATKYITKEVTLDQSSSSIRVIAAVCRQAPCDIDFYYKTKTSEEQIFAERPYTLMDRPTNYTNVSTNSRDYKEYEFDVRDIPEFTSVAVKIVMKTKNSAIVPTVKDLRIVALAS